MGLGPSATSRRYFNSLIDGLCNGCRNPTQLLHWASFKRLSKEWEKGRDLQLLKVRGIRTNVTKLPIGPAEILGTLEQWTPEHGDLNRKQAFGLWEKGSLAIGARRSETTEKSPNDFDPLVRMTRNHITHLGIDGKDVGHDPNVLRRLKDRHRLMGVRIAFPKVSKADPLGEYDSRNGNFFLHLGDGLDIAGAFLDNDITNPCVGEDRVVTPLYVDPKTGKPWRTADVDELLMALLKALIYA